MPPIPDRHLEERILKAAQRLWQTRGGKGLTLRGVAREAGTTTPTLYQRFRNKEALLHALALRFRNAVIAELFSSSSVEDGCRRYLRYAESHPHEYELLYRYWRKLEPDDGPRPGRAWLVSQLAARFGGRPEDYTPLFYSFFLICHGAASLLVSEGNVDVRDQIRQGCMRTVETILENMSAFATPALNDEWNGS